MTVKNNYKVLLEETERRILASGNKEFIQLEYFDKFSSDGKKVITGKDLGKKYSTISSFFFEYLKEFHIPTSYQKIDFGVIYFSFHKRFPFYTKILNAADNKLSKVFTVKEFEQLDLPVLELYYSNSKEVLINDSHLIALNFATYEEIKLMYRISSKVNAVLKSFFERRNALLIEFNCIFAKTENKIVVVDDFSPKSLKVKSHKNKEMIVNPYKIATSADIKNYTEYLLNLIRQ